MRECGIKEVSRYIDTRSEAEKYVVLAFFSVVASYSNLSTLHFTGKGR